MGQTTKQHYVPQFYLRNFTAPGPSGREVLWVYDKVGGTPRPQTTYNTMAEYGFYDFENNTGDIQALDKGMQQLEGAAAPILKRLSDPRVNLTDEEIALFAGFLALTYVRVPTTLKAIEELKQAFAFEMLKFGTKQPEIWQRISEFTRQKYGDEDGKEQQILQIMREPEKYFRVQPNHEDAVAESLKAIIPIAELLYYRMNWTICQAPIGSFFITSDMPLCVFVPTGKGRGKFGGGFEEKEVQVTFPVTPQVLLLIDWKDRQHHMRVGEAFVREKNEHMARIAERWVIAHTRSRTVETLVKTAAVSRKYPKLDPTVIGREVASRLRKLRPDRSK